MNSFFKEVMKLAQYYGVSVKFNITGERVEVTLVGDMFVQVFYIDIFKENEEEALAKIRHELSEFEKNRDSWVDRVKLMKSIELVEE